MPCNGLKKGSFRLFLHPKWSGIIFGKTLFDPFLTHFWSQNGPFSRHFVTLEGQKGPPRAQNAPKTLALAFHVVRIIFEKVFFLHPVDLVDPFWHPPLWATSGSLPQPIGPRYGGLGVG